jgi:cobalamin-dependent methionine synthase I
MGARLLHKFEDDYQQLMARIMCDRFIAAMADHVGADAVQFTYGYPATPDHSMKRTLFEILEVPEDVVRLSENYSMWPTASASGFYVHNPQAHYFSVGIIDDEQQQQYAERAGISVQELRRNIPNNVK